MELIIIKLKANKSFSHCVPVFFSSFRGRGYTIAFIAGLLAITNVGIAQQQNPKHYTDTATGKLYWNRSQPVYLWVSSQPDHAEEPLKKSPNTRVSVPFYLDTEGPNYIRSKNAVDPDTKETAKPLQEVMLEIYADGIAPETNIALDAYKKYTSAKGVLYYGPSLSFTVNATDKTSGVENIFYSINGQPFTAFNDKQIISEQGDYNLQFYATDNVGNASKVKQHVFTVDNTPPFTNINVNGISVGNQISPATKIYINQIDTVSGINNTYFKFDNTSFEQYNGRALDISRLSEGKHLISYYSDDKVGNKEEPKLFDFYLDKSAPIMAADILGDRFIANNTVYFSGKTKLKLTAIDNKVGVKEVRYAIDGETFKTYTQPFYLPNVSGMHDIKFYSVDNLNNQTTSADGSGYEEFKHNVTKVYVDLTGPTMSHKILGDVTFRRDTMLLGPKNKIVLSATDPESGLQKITYSFDGQLIENDYKTPISMDKDGYHLLEYFGYDNVNNRNPDAFYFITDNTGPEIYHYFTVGSIDTKNGVAVYPASAGLSLAGTDELSGLKTIMYSVDGQPEKLYSTTITGLKHNAKHTIKITATDYLGNESFDEISFYLKK
ncbi:OmpL47-type beta-barrel domain-containing protein [Parasediminibacterium sp. JCM 36343]|uniref:OmpL47-type beta-barrel domain-containing protein n=1 Tax=Parasediminibacterium sp. JCM 36343 TaxID=3374279 RepID=UPI00397AA1F6